MKRLLATLAVGAPVFALAALTVENFHWSRPLEGAPVKQTTVVAVPFDAGMFAATADAFRDLRLLNDAGVETAHAVEKVRAVRQHTVQRSVASKLVALKELPENRIEAEFELTATNAVADGFSVTTPLRDFQHTVKVEGSRDGMEWATLVADAPLLDYTRYMDLRHLDVKLPPSACRRFKLTISNITGEQTLPLTRLMQQTGGAGGKVEQRTVDLKRQTFRVDRVSFWRNEIVDGAAEEIRTAWPLTGFKVERDTKERTTLVTIEAGRLPLNRLTLEFAEHNFSRSVSVELPTVRNGLAAWTGFASARLLNVELPGYSKRDLEINFGELRAEQIRLVLHDGDNPPLTIKAITGSGPTWRALFLAEPVRSYRLLYGAEKLAAPHYDLESVLAPARRGLNPVAWQLGAAVENKTYQPAGTPLGWLNSSWTFGAAIVLMLLVLGVLLLRVGKTAGQHLDDTKPGG
jgi:hypothetical protein